MPKSIPKEVLDISSSMSDFKCQCDAEYISRTKQMFEERIDQHVPAKFVEDSMKISIHLAIKELLINNQTCPLSEICFHIRMIN